MKVYGGCIEPGGLDLADDRNTAFCPECKSVANSWYIERAESGSLNTYSGLACLSCDYAEGDDPDSDED